MTGNQLFCQRSLSILFASLLTLTSPQLSGAQATSGQKTFPTASAAAEALVAAARAGDQDQLLAILGRMEKTWSPPAIRLRTNGPSSASRNFTQRSTRYPLRHRASRR